MSSEGSIGCLLSPRASAGGHKPQNANIPFLLRFLALPVTAGRAFFLPHSDSQAVFGSFAVRNLLVLLALRKLTLALLLDLMTLLALLHIRLPVSLLARVAN